MTSWQPILRPHIPYSYMGVSKKKGPRKQTPIHYDPYYKDSKTGPSYHRPPRCSKCQVPYRGPIDETIRDLQGGVRSACTCPEPGGDSTGPRRSAVMSRRASSKMSHSIHMYRCIHICVYLFMCMYVCMYVCIYIYIYICLCFLFQASGCLYNFGVLFTGVLVMLFRVCVRAHLGVAFERRITQRQIEGPH